MRGRCVKEEKEWEGDEGEEEGKGRGKEGAEVWRGWGRCRKMGKN